MDHIFVIDTVSLINYYNDIFDEADKISKEARRIIHNGFNPLSNFKLIIPSIVFLEIHTKFLKTEEFLLKFKYEIFLRIKESPDIEIKPIEKNVLQIFSNLDDGQIKLEHNDKLVLSSAVDMNAPLLTIDPVIIKYVRKHKCIPSVIP